MATEKYKFIAGRVEAVWDFIVGKLDKNINESINDPRNCSEIYQILLYVHIVIIPFESVKAPLILSCAGAVLGIWIGYNSNCWQTDVI